MKKPAITLAVASLVLAACATTSQSGPQEPRGMTDPEPPAAVDATPVQVAVPEPAPTPAAPTESATTAQPEPEPQPEESVDPVTREESVEAKGTVAQLRQRVLASQRKWNAELPRHGGRYSYGTGFGSWVGFGHQSKVTVDGGRVVEHAYREFNRDRKTTKQWIERGAAVGTHAPPPPVVDQLYAECLNDVLTKNPADHAFYVAFFSNGLLADCSYRHKQCADDCSDGPAIWFIRWE